MLFKMHHFINLKNDVFLVGERNQKQFEGGGGNNQKIGIISSK